MGFIEQHLTNSEQIVHKGHLHWFAYAGGLVLITALWAVAMVILAFNAPEIWAFVVVEHGILYYQQAADCEEGYHSAQYLRTPAGEMRRRDGGTEHAGTVVQLWNYQNYHGRSGEHL